MKRSSLHILIAGCIMAVYTVVSSMDFEDEQRDFDHYCNMVEQGHWPDFKEIADKCPKDEPTVRVSKDLGTSEP
jgi:hypothetical protein